MFFILLILPHLIASTPSSISCVFSSIAGTFDLTALSLRHTAPDGWLYAFSACTASDGFTVEPKCVKAAPAPAFQVTLGLQPTCFSLGTLPSRTLASLPGALGVSVSYSGGDGGRRVVLEATCFDGPDTIDAAVEERPLEYVLRARSRAACPAECARDPHTGAICGGRARGACAAATGDGAGSVGGAGVLHLACGAAWAESAFGALRARIIRAVWGVVPRIAGTICGCRGARRAGGERTAEGCDLAAGAEGVWLAQAAGDAVLAEEARVAGAGLGAGAADCAARGAVGVAGGAVDGARELLILVCRTGLAGRLGGVGAGCRSCCVGSQVERLELARRAEATVLAEGAFCARKALTLLRADERGGGGGATELGARCAGSDNAADGVRVEGACYNHVGARAEVAGLAEGADKARVRRLVDFLVEPRRADAGEDIGLPAKRMRGISWTLLAGAGGSFRDSGVLPGAAWTEFADSHAGLECDGSCGTGLADSICFGADLPRSRAERARSTGGGISLGREGTGCARGTGIVS